jgi:dipeptidyl aminopeptidase/acylaminoacyl peptidase
MASRGDISWRGTLRGYVTRAVGEDEAELVAASPASHPERLTMPVFLAHGGRDDRAPIVHAERLRAALTRLGRPPIWLEESTEGHGFFDEGARLRFYERLVAFLKRYTAPPAPALAVTPPPAATLPAGPEAASTPTP